MSSFKLLYYVIFLNYWIDASDRIQSLQCLKLILNLQTCPSVIGQIYCIAKNKDKQELLREEVDKYVPKNGNITADMIAKMTYLKACVKEGFRFIDLA